MIRLQQRERGIYVERFDCGMWKLLTITDTQAQALQYIKSNAEGEIHVQLLSSKSKRIKGSTS